MTAKRIKVVAELNNGAVISRDKKVIPFQSNGKNLKDKKQEKKRYKIIAGNGCHQAIAEVHGVLICVNDIFTLLLQDGNELNVTFPNQRVKWLAKNKPDYVLGKHWFRGYPKMKDNKLVGFQLIGWEGNMPTNNQEKEVWSFTGLWTLQKNLTVQRSMTNEDVRKIAKETGYIKKFKYTFANAFDFIKAKKLWIGYVYKIECERNGLELVIRKITPFACPRIKPTMKSKGGKKHVSNSGAKSKYNEAR